MKIAGYLFIGLGIVDVGLSWIGIDLYWEIGINLPDWLYPMTGLIAMTIGIILLFMETEKNNKTQ